MQVIQWSGEQGGQGLHESKYLQYGAIFTEAQNS